MSNAITIRILAEKLGLSIGTVSKALKDSHEIKNETKQKVRELAGALNYTPNPYASSLRKGTSKTIAVVLPEVADSFFSQAINGIESISGDKGYHVLIYLTHELVAREEMILQDFQSGRVDGILISVSQETKQSDHIKKLVASGLPVVFFDRICDDVQTPKVITNDFECGYIATRHLLEKGCKKLAFISVPGNIGIINQRSQGYKKAALEAGLKTGAALILQCPGGEEERTGEIKKMLRKKNRPDGIIASMEKLATTVYSVCNELQLSIPQDIKVIAFSNLPIAGLLHPPLTTITQPAFEMGKAATALLFKAIEKKMVRINEEIIIPSVLVERASTSGEWPHTTSRRGRV